MGQGNGHGTLVMKNERAVGSRLQEVIEERHALAFHFCDVVESHLGLEPSTWMEGQRVLGHPDPERLRQAVSSPAERAWGQPSCPLASGSLVTSPLSQDKTPRAGPW